MDSEYLKDESGMPLKSDIEKGIEGVLTSKAWTRPGEALGNAISAVTSAPDLPTGIQRGAAEVLASGLDLGGDVLEMGGVDTSVIPDWTGESAAGLIKTTLGDESAKDTPITTRGGEEYTLGGIGVKTAGEAVGGVVEGVKEDFWNSLPEDVRTGLSGLGRTAMLGALSELWGAANRSLSSPLETAGNAINQVSSVTNKLDI